MSARQRKPTMNGGIWVIVRMLWLVLTLLLMVCVTPGVAGAEPCVFIVPVHPPKFGYLQGAIKSWVSLATGCDLYAILSSRPERLALQKYLPSYMVAADNHTFHAISIEEEAPDQLPILTELIPRKSVISYKKLWALDHLKLKYQWYVVVDAEFRFVRPFNATAVEAYFRNQVIVDVACPSLFPLFQEINNVSLSMLPTELLARLDTQRLRTHHFFWWNRLPIYAGHHIPHFLNTVQFYQGGLYRSLTQWTFDYLMYEFYLLSAHGFRLESVDDPAIQALFCNARVGLSIVEQLTIQKVDRYPAISTLMWLPCRMHKHEILHKCPQCILAFHFDRNRCEWN